MLLACKILPDQSNKTPTGSTSLLMLASVAASFAKASVLPECCKRSLSKAGNAAGGECMQRLAEHAGTRVCTPSTQVLARRSPQTSQQTSIKGKIPR
jgi:hypothetical protein